MPKEKNPVTPETIRSNREILKTKWIQSTGRVGACTNEGLFSRKEVFNGGPVLNHFTHHLN